MSGPGYHLRDIPRGHVGHVSKIVEEALEAADADDQGVAVMVLIELSDLVGAVKSYLEAHHPTVTLEDLERMAEVTARAFRNGHRG